jgi:predicted lipoprotein with Yx(FWY)xxD motif
MFSQHRSEVGARTPSYSLRKPLHGSVKLAVGLALLVMAELSAAALPVEPFWQSKDNKEREAFVPVQLPPGIKVMPTELEGPVFADEKGMTLYVWPQQQLRNGNLGDRSGNGESTCVDTIYKETSGLMSPYPPGFLLPDLDKRRSCEQVWKPKLAAADATPIGNWTLIKRKNGQMQWAYDGLPVYTSDRDRQPGDVLGGTQAIIVGEQGAARFPVGPPSDVPPELEIVPFRTGHMVITSKGYSVYSSDADAPNKSNCNDECLRDWAPVAAPQIAKPRGEWTVIERSPGVLQWAYRGKPLYTYRVEKRTRSMTGSDVPGWRNVFTQRAYSPPSEFTVQDSRIGQVLADASGKTIYLYHCNDDALDQQACDHPDAPQEYRLAICGNFDPKVCQETFPYVPARRGAKADSALWTAIDIDPNTGRRAKSGESGAITVWAYRDRPVYTYGEDEKPGDVNGDNYGEFNGARNGFKAFWLRDDYRDNVMGLSLKDLTRR